MCVFRDMEMESDHDYDRHSVITEVAHEAKDAFWDRQKVSHITFHLWKSGPTQFTWN